MRYELFQKYSINKILFIVGLLSLFFLLIFFHFKGITYYDEGYILNAALRITHGQVPYRDFDMVYTPLSYFITSGFLSLFGDSVFSGRLAALTISLLSLVALYKIITLFTKKTVLILLSLFLFVSWGPTHTNFPWPTMFAMCFALYSLLFYLKGLHETKMHYFYFAGVLAIVTFFAKQNFGVGISGLLLISFLFTQHENKIRAALSYIFGITSASFLALLILVHTDIYFAFLYNMYHYTFQSFIMNKTLDTPFLYEGSLLSKLIKLCFYTLPITLSAFALFLAWKRHKKNLFLLPLFTMMFYLIGIRPTTDYVHIAPLLALSSLSLATISIVSRNTYLKRATIFFTILLIGLGFYTAYFSGYYKWNSPLKDNTVFMNDPQMKIWVTQVNADETKQLKEYIQSKTKRNDPIFVNYYAPFIYFLTDRPNVSRYDFVFPNQIPINYQKETVQRLQKNKVKIVIMHGLNENEQSIIANYTHKTYPIQKVIGGYIVFSK